MENLLDFLRDFHPVDVSSGFYRMRPYTLLILGACARDAHILRAILLNTSSTIKYLYYFLVVKYV